MLNGPYASQPHSCNPLPAYLCIPEHLQPLTQHHDTVWGMQHTLQQVRPPAPKQRQHTTSCAPYSSSMQASCARERSSVVANADIQHCSVLACLKQWAKQLPAELQPSSPPAYVGQASKGMAQHLHVWLAAVAAAHELQQRLDALTVNHQLTAGLAVAGAELNGCNSSDHLQASQPGLGLDNNHHNKLQGISMVLHG